MQATNKAVRCDCGHEVHGVSEEQLLAEVQDHAREAHGIEFSREDALLVVLRAELQEAWPEKAQGQREAGAAAAAQSLGQKGATS